MENLQLILLNSILAGLATTAGGLLTILYGTPRERLLASLLAGAGGMMMAVVIVDLLPTAWLWGSASQFIGGLLAGLLFMGIATRKMDSPADALPLTRRMRLKRLGILIAAGIALHDLPEGMAIAASQEAAPHLGWLIALAIALHNFPEGMAATVPLMMAQISPWKILVLNLSVAFFTPLGALLGVFALYLVQNSLSFFLAFAAGSMAFLVLAELWPLSRERHPLYALLGGFIGFVPFTLFSILH